ncbi:unnamed protein product [Tilletia controversa]|nr:unnamed protein product [Tilletia controversa]
MELWMQIAQEVAWARPDTIRKEDGASMAWQYGPKDHPLIALSQTCKTFQAIAAPLIWSNITFGQNWDDGGLDLIPKLIVCLKNPIVRETIESLDIDMDLNIDCLAPWEYGSWEGPDSVPTYLDLLALTTQLGDALRGTGLRDLRFCANWNNPSDAFLEAVGQGCPQLEHIELAYGSDNEPNVQEIDDVAVNGPDKLDELSQVRSACIGMGSIHDNDVLRLANGSYPYALEKHTPFLVKWLRGEVPSDASKEFNEVDNKLVHIKTSAPFLYRHQCLAPAWARFNHILEKIDGDNAEIEMSFTSGEMFDEDRCPGGDNYEEEMSWVRAASALRPSLDRLAAKEEQRDLSAEDVVGMMRTDPVFAPWRKAWFEGRTQKVEVAPLDGPSLAKEILHCWRKSAQSRLESPDPPARWVTGWPGGW